MTEEKYDLAIPGGGMTCPYFNGLGRRTAPNCPIDNIAENTGVANVRAKKNPEALAGASGVKLVRKALQLSQDLTLIFAPSASLVAAHG